MTQKIRWGVLGAAKIATAKVIPAMQRGKLTEITAIASRDLGKAQAEAKAFAELLRSLPDRLRAIETIELNIDALCDANVAGSAVNAVDAGTWQAEALETNRERT